ncbi:MAG TPA: peptidase domain-containing protein [Thermomicrobiaceae bacterium]|nr:peptidase domain-containing protein [Thermomicrobiaceae bacterium]
MRMPRARTRGALLLVFAVILSASPFTSLIRPARAAAALAPTGLVAYLDRANNLWVSQDNGAAPKQLTTAGGYTSFTWSPDGSLIAVVGPGGVSLVSADGSLGVRGLHTGSDPVWSPDSSRLALIDSGWVYTYDRNGAAQRSVGVAANQILWSPNGGRIGFTHFLSDPYNAGCAVQDLGWIDANSGSSTVVAQAIGKFAWAGDGNRLLYVSVADGFVHSYDVSNGTDRVISQRLANPCGGPFFTSTDGSTLFFLDYGAGGHDLVALNLTTLQQRDYPNLPVSFPSNNLPDAYVTVDPLGQYAYVVESYPTTITRVDLSSGATTTLLSNDARMVIGFSPDHDRVALIDTPYGKPSVTAIRSLTSGAEVSFANVGWIAWQPTPITPTVTAAWSNVWNREDRPVAAGAAQRTWIWGPAPFATRQEVYAQAPGGRRAVEYFDKSRMEVTNPGGDQSSIWYVTNGLLVKEMITGQMQVGDNQFVTRTPAQIPVAGDPTDTSGPTYATLQAVLNAPAAKVGTPITQTIDRAGTVGSGGPAGATAAEFVPQTNHTIADVFWSYMNSQGTIWNGSAFVNGPLFPNPFYATGYPITEPYWSTVLVGGQLKQVLVQCFERRCLTYTPSNPAGWKVEMGNVGRHYYEWRYGTQP